MTTAYDADGDVQRQRRTDGPRVVWSDGVVAVLAATVVVAVWAAAGGHGTALRVVGIGAAGTLVAVWVDRRAARHREVGSSVPLPALMGVVAVLAAFGAHRSAAEWAGAVPRATGTYEGWAEVASDPVSAFGAVQVDLEIEGERFRLTGRGTIGRRAAALVAGDLVLVRGERRTATDSQRRRLQARHVVGVFDAHWLADVATGSPMMRAASRVRTALRHGAESVMSPDDAALFTGLVIGDDARQPAAMVDRFRRSGLSHLTAVSGQNVAYVLALAGVVLRRLRTWPRFAATAGIVGWFVVLTRVEPSVLRAGTMALLAALAFATGQERSPFRLLCLALVVLVLIDPFLVWSVGFWLSTGATVGVTVVAPWIARHCRGPRWLVPAVAVSAGAQLGVALPSLLVFHRLPAGGVAANLLAVPVAGFVMLSGIPAGLVAAAVPHGLAVVVMWPASIGTRWVAAVATLAARFEPSGAVAAGAWVVQIVALGLALGPRRAPAVGPGEDEPRLGSDVPG